jgi:hypothetical protein
MAVLFTILFQSIHSYEHHSEQITAKLSHKHLSKNKAEISKNNSIPEKCATCDFNFSSFTTTDFFVFQIHKNGTVTTFYSFLYHQQSSFFAGSLFSLRGPPLV